MKYSDESRVSAQGYRASALAVTSCEVLTGFVGRLCYGTSRYASRKYPIQIQRNSFQYIYSEFPKPATKELTKDICMQKILFDRKNAQNIAEQSADVCNVYNKLSDASLTKLELLNAIAQVFGYNSGWAELMAVNKSARFYISFSLSVCSHVRAIINQLSSFLPSHVKPDLLLTAVSYTELGVKNPEQFYKCQNEDIFELEDSVLWFTDNVNSSLKHLANSPSASLLTKQGIYFKHFKILWPELYRHLHDKYNLSPNQVLLFKQPTWWGYRDHFIADYQREEIGQWEIHFNEPKSSERICYEPIYDSQSAKFPEEIANLFAEGLNGCPQVEHFGKDMSDEDYVLACLEYWKTLPHIKDIKFSLRKEHIKKQDYPIFSLLRQFFTEHNEAIDLIKGRLTDMDFTGELWGYEPRFVYSRKGEKRIYQEPWIVESDVRDFIDVNETIFQDNIIYSPLSSKYIETMLDNYRRERFLSIF